MAMRHGKPTSAQPVTAQPAAVLHFIWFQSNSARHFALGFSRALPSVTYPNHNATPLFAISQKECKTKLETIIKTRKASCTLAAGSTEKPRGTRAGTRANICSKQKPTKGASGFGRQAKRPPACCGGPAVPSHARREGLPCTHRSCCAYPVQSQARTLLHQPYHNLQTSSSTFISPHCYQTF